MKSEETIPDKTKKALAYCEKLRQAYAHDASFHRTSYFFSQIATVVLSGITPLLIILDNTPKIVQALPPALASMTAGLAVYNWHKNWISCQSTAEALEVEKIKFELRIGEDYKSDLAEDLAIGNFIYKIDQINRMHLQQWRNEIIEQSTSAKVLEVSRELHQPTNTESSSVNTGVLKEEIETSINKYETSNNKGII